MGRRRRDRLYWREGRGWYGDFRDFADVGGEYGGRQKALIEPGGPRRATQDEAVARRLCSRILEELEERRRRRQGGGDPRLGPYASSVLRRELELHGLRESTIRTKRDGLRNVLEFFGEDVRLSEIDVAGLNDYVAWRSAQPGRSGTPISVWTIRGELNALSSIYKWALSEGAARLNPVAMMPKKPKKPKTERVYLEEAEAARLLEAAREVDADARAQSAEDGRLRLTFIEPIVATFLLTGGRKSEVLGLLRSDLEETAVRIRENRHRKLKRPWHARRVPLWPQLEEILAQYLDGLTLEPDALLFPSPVTGAMLTDIRGPMTAAIDRAEISKRVTPHTFRHTYAARRIQTTDAGQPVSLYTVARELGHRGLSMLEETYGHLHTDRRRTDVVEYRRESRLQGAVPSTP